MMPQKSFDFGPIYLKKLDCFARQTHKTQDLCQFSLEKALVGELSSDDQAPCFWHLLYGTESVRAAVRAASTGKKVAEHVGQARTERLAGSRYRLPFSASRHQPEHAEATRKERKRRRNWSGGHLHVVENWRGLRAARRGLCKGQKGRAGAI